jgi:hypothetical protein
MPTTLQQTMLPNSTAVPLPTTDLNPKNSAIALSLKYGQGADL